MEAGNPLGEAQEENRSKKATQTRAAKLKAKAISKPTTSKAQEKVEIRYQRALEKQAAKGAREAEKARLLEPIEFQEPIPGTSKEILHLLSPRGEKRGCEELDLESEAQEEIITSGADSPGQSPGRGEASGLSPPTHQDKPRGVNRPIETKSAGQAADMEWLLAEATRRGFEAGLQHKKADPREGSHKGKRVRLHAPHTKASVPEVAFSSQSSSSQEEEEEEEEGQIDWELSEEEGLQEEQPMFKGLFKTHMFRSLLAKAKAVTGLGLEADMEEPSTSRGPSDFLFSEAKEETDSIPASKLFLQVVRKQLEMPGTYPSPTAFDKKYFNMAADFSDMLSTPEVDEPVVALATPTAPLSDADEVLKPEDRRAELTLKKAHQAAAWAVKTASAASFFSRAALLWLRQLQARVSPQDVRVHQDFNKIVAATEYTADATLHAAKFGTRAVASTITARRLLWLRHWQADAKKKWKLASMPCKADKLFGEALDPVLVESRDKKKILPSLSRRGDRRSPPSFRGRPYRSNYYNSGYQRPFVSFNPRQDYRPRQGFRDKDRSQGQFKRPFRGGGGRGYRRSK